MENRIDAIYARQSVDRKDSISIENTVKPRKCLRRKASSDRSDEFTTNLLLWEKLAALRNSQLNKFNIPPAGL